MRWMERTALPEEWDAAVVRVRYLHEARHLDRVFTPI